MSFGEAPLETWTRPEVVVLVAAEVTIPVLATDFLVVRTAAEVVATPVHEVVVALSEADADPEVEVLEDSLAEPETEAEVEAELDEPVSTGPLEVELEAAAAEVLVAEVVAAALVVSEAIAVRE